MNRIKYSECELNKLSGQLFSHDYHSIRTKEQRVRGNFKSFRIKASIKMGQRYLENLQKHILQLSEASDFNIARTEWIVDHIYKSTHLETCPCSTPIIEHCCIRNMINGNTTFVGSICIRRFMDIDAHKLFNGLKKIEKDLKAKPNHDLIEYARRSGHLYGDNEYRFLKSIEKIDNLSAKQKQWLYFINRRITRKIVVRPLPNQHKLDSVNMFNRSSDDERNNTTEKNCIELQEKVKLPPITSRYTCTPNLNQYRPREIEKEKKIDFMQCEKTFY